MRRHLVAATVLVGCTLAGQARRAAAQQAQGELHGNFAHGTATGTNAWGAGVALPLTWGGTKAPVNVVTSPGVDYTKQEQGGPAQAMLSLDATLQPGGGAAVTPYAGGSVSANWSLGDAKQWTGARLGLEAIGGLTAKLGGALSAKAEERFGYVHGQEHTLTTRLGVVVSL